MIRSTRTVAPAGDVEMLELQMSDDRPGFRDSVLYVVDVLGVEPRLFNHEAAARAHKGHPTATVTAVPGYYNDSYYDSYGHWHRASEAGR